MPMCWRKRKASVAPDVDFPKLICSRGRLLCKADLGNRWHSSQHRDIALALLCFCAVLQRSENPLLQNDSAWRLYIPKLHAHTQSRLDIDHRAFCLEVLIGIENFYEDRREFGKWSGRLEVTAMETDFCGANRDSGAGRVLWSDLGGSIEQESKTTAVLVHGF
jgi:hypothetical protein